MKIKQLKENIEREGGEITLGDVVFKYKEGEGNNNVDVSVGNIPICWFHDYDEKEAEDEMSIWSTAINHIEALRVVARYIGVPTQGVEPIIVEKQVMVQDVEKDKELAKAKTDWQRSENERGAEKRTYQWVVSELAEKLRD